ncbi:MAG TPA: S8 family serine peptidase [Dongiaceae bacterium]|nr:S8 family serine peptidase [Dongiaceae bacterium]
MKRTTGRWSIIIGLVDGPVDMENPGLATEAVREMATEFPRQKCSCQRRQSSSCRHGTFVAGILAARRGSGAPAICPGCTLLIRPIFTEEESPDSTPTASARELAEAITEVVQAGSNLVNLSCQLPRGSASADHDLNDAFDFAASRGAICIAAAGNEGRLGSSAITRHQWVIPVAACDRAGRPADGTNLGHSIGRRGLLAPGEGIRSLGPEREDFAVSGTSAAAPFVTGAAALLWSEFTGATAADVWQALNLGHAVRRTGVVPPRLDAWGSFERLAARLGRGPSL